MPEQTGSDVLKTRLTGIFSPAAGADPSKRTQRGRNLVKSFLAEALKKDGGNSHLLKDGIAEYHTNDDFTRKVIVQPLIDKLEEVRSAPLGRLKHELIIVLSHMPRAFGDFEFAQKTCWKMDYLFTATGDIGFLRPLGTAASSHPELADFYFEKVLDIGEAKQSMHEKVEVCKALIPMAKTNLDRAGRTITFLGQLASDDSLSDVEPLEGLGEIALKYKSLAERCANHLVKVANKDRGVDKENNRQQALRALEKIKAKYPDLQTRYAVKPDPAPEPKPGQ